MTKKQHCAAFGCHFQSEGNKGRDVSLHSFPTGKKRRKQWEDACGRTQLPKDLWLCSQHFSPDAFEANSCIGHSGIVNPVPLNQSRCTRPGL
uniref:THAP domain-containing protein 1 n=1 Tax=Nothobranchius furzeri TaxID=105023 RepID=A0A8C6MGS6_NOTFU